MSSNRDRRQARRQHRGVRRAEAVLDAAEQVFAEVGYDEATTAAIACRAGVSPGSLYQFFPNKEAVARALAARYVEELRRVHDTGLMHSTALHPLPDALDRILDPIVAFNRAHPALTRLFGGTVLSPALEGALDALHAEVIQRFDAAFAARLPHVDPELRLRTVKVSLRIALSLLPWTVDPDSREAFMMTRELKGVLYGYWAPLFEGSEDKFEPLPPI